SLTHRPPPPSTLFPYTTLFRSDIFMDQLVQDLGVDAVAVLLYEPAGQVLRPSVGRGFTAELRQRLRLALGDGPAGRAALEQRSIFLPDLANEPQKGAEIGRAHV